MNFLCHAKKSTIKENELKSISFHVLLSGLLLMRRAVNSGSTCMPWIELRTQISKMLINSGFQKRNFSLKIGKNGFCQSAQKVKKARIKLLNNQ